MAALVLLAVLDVLAVLLVLDVLGMRHLQSLALIRHPRQPGGGRFREEIPAAGACRLACAGLPDSEFTPPRESFVPR
jgi:hypothetical protein